MYIYIHKYIQINIFKPGNCIKLYKYIKPRIKNIEIEFICNIYINNTTKRVNESKEITTDKNVVIMYSWS